MIAKILKQLRVARFQKKVTKCIKKANEISKLTGYKCFVLSIKGNPTVIKKVDIKENLKRGVFKKGTTIQDIESTAMYVTI